MFRSITGIIPARKGSQRIPNKNSLVVNGHPLFAYAIASAKQSNVFEKILVASDDEIICRTALGYGADLVVKRDSADSTSTSLDIDWLTNLEQSSALNTEYFAILRPTSPQRSPNLIRNCTLAFLNSDADSLRTISKVTEHPGKMWRIKGNSLITPYLTQRANQHATHAMQYQSLETLYVQNSVYEIAKTENIRSTFSREGKNVLGFITDGMDSFALDTVDDLQYLLYKLEQNPNLLPIIPFKVSG
jgi:CMP-N-acetylneuraminic acid synthetase